MIPFKSKLSRFKDIEKRNDAFNKLSKEQQRREIAFEALNLVVNKILLPAKGMFWNDYLRYTANEKKSSKELQELLLDSKFLKKYECRVCQRGLMMISQIRLSNSISPLEEDKDCGDDKLIKGFDYNTFKEMENEYEYSSFDHPYKTRSAQKLANICCNVLVHGDFNTGDTTDYLIEWKIKIN